jgi:D-serine deaminase-like pyridoxal phosphate-dependent protein
MGLVGRAVTLIRSHLKWRKLFENQHEQVESGSQEITMANVMQVVHAERT